MQLANNLIVACLLAVVASAVAAPDAAQPVAVSLYMESLCPGCQYLFAHQFFPTWQKLAATGIMTVDVVPYGNADESQQGDKWVFNCQHGPNECVGNQFETCAIKLLSGPQQWMPYMHCLELKLSASGGQNVPQAAKDCASQQNVSFDAISQCSLSSQGNQWQHEMAQKTDALNPPHQYVPWITVNGKHTTAIQNKAESNMLKLVCDTYTGTKPKECSQAVDLSTVRCPRN